MIYFALIIRRLCAAWGMSLLALWAVYVLFDTVEHTRIVRAYNAPYSRLLDLALAHSPTAVYQLAPLALLLSSAAVMLGMMRSAELTALLAGGQSLRRRLLPFALFALAVAALTFIFGEALVPAAQSRYVELIDLEIKHKNTWGDKWRGDRQWFHGPGGFWHIGGRRSNDRILRDVKFYRMNPDFRLNEILEMKSLKLDDKGRWTAEGLKRLYAAGANSDSDISLNFEEKAQHFEYVWRTADEMTLAELDDAAALRRSQGLSDRSYKLARAMRPAYMPLILLLPFLSAAIIWNRRFILMRPGVWAGTGLTLGAGLLVFFAVAAFKSAGDTGIIAGEAAAFIPVIILFLCCLAGLRRIIS